MYFAASRINLVFHLINIEVVFLFHFLKSGQSVSNVG